MANDPTVNGATEKSDHDTSHLIANGDGQSLNVRKGNSTTNGTHTETYTKSRATLRNTVLEFPFRPIADDD